MAWFVFRLRQRPRQTYILDTGELPLVDRPRARQTDLKLDILAGWLKSCNYFLISPDKAPVHCWSISTCCQIRWPWQRFRLAAVRISHWLPGLWGLYGSGVEACSCVHVHCDLPHWRVCCLEQRQCLSLSWWILMWQLVVFRAGKVNIGFTRGREALDSVKLQLLLPPYWQDWAALRLSWVTAGRITHHRIYTL